MERGRSPYLLVSYCDTVENIDFDEVLHFHRRHNADVTVIYSEEKEDTNQDGFALTTDDGDRVTAITEKRTYKKEKNGITVSSSSIQKSIKTLCVVPMPADTTTSSMTF